MSATTTGSAPREFRRIDALVCVLIFCVSCLAYVQVLQHGFVSYDDPVYITSNQVVQGGLNSEGLRWAFSEEQASNWHPLTWLSHMLDCTLFGLDAGWHHAMNVLMHALSACLLFVALRMLTGRLWPAVLVAALFALHPLRVESVAWASERKDVLSGLCWMATLLAYAWYVRRPKLVRYLPVALFFALGLLAKPMLVTLPFVLLLLDYWPLERLRAGVLRLVVEKLPLFALSAVSIFMTIGAQSSGGALRTLASLPLETRLAMVPRAYVFYLAKAFWPADLAVFYPHPAIGTGVDLHFTDGKTLGALAILAVLTGIAWLYRKRAAWGIVGWLWFLGTLVPVIGIVQVGDQAVADRYAYLPLIGLTLPLAWGLAEFARDRAKLCLLASILIVAACFGRTWNQVPHWKDSMTLFQHALDVTSGNYVAFTNVGIEFEKLNSTQEAEQHFEAAIEVRPNFSPALLRLGQSLLTRGQVERPRVLLEKAVESAPNRSDARIGLASLYIRTGELASAQRMLLAALEITPNNELALCNLGALEEQRGNDRAAIEHYERALDLKPDFVTARLNLAALHDRRGEHAQAARAYREILAIAPGNLLAVRGLAWVLATASDKSVRNPAEALRLAQDASQRTAQRTFQVFTTLAAAQAAAGNFAQAVQTQKAALSQAPVGERARLEAHLKIYGAQRSLEL